ncbi:MAG: gamma-butyrobetaine,2-oxoglutarate dioxygenase [Actinomyces sp.]|nr:MAG: gamma-butyrobetaine,2-oxoglutarate dioxygenase [Actinomyces sp.]
MVTAAGSRREPPTPDFHRYRVVPLAAATLDGPLVTLDWPDGTHLTVHALWLWENRFGTAIEPRTREGMLDPAELPPPDVLVGVRPDDDGHLLATWAHGEVSRHHAGWLRHVAAGVHRPGALIPDPEPWTTAELSEPPTLPGPPVLAGDPVALRSFLELLCRRGLARLEGLPTSSDVVERVAAHIGALRDTNFGITWSVTVDVDPSSTANTNLPLPAHTDLPTRETPPGFQFLHCRVNTCHAGFSHMSDGLAVVAELARSHPDAHEALTTLRWIFFDRSPEHDHRWSGPIIDAIPGRPLTVRAFHPVRAFPDMDPAEVGRAYDALRTFARVAASDAFQMRYPFRPGDLVAFDNRRILHGRGAIDGGGTRALTGCYLDNDEVYSRLRVLTRAATNGEVP